MSLRDRIRRALHGPTDAEISAESRTLGGPPYPIPPTSTQPPTAITPGVFAVGGPVIPPPGEALRERARRAATALTADRAEAAETIRRAQWETAVQNQERGLRRLTTTGDYPDLSSDIERAATRARLAGLRRSAPPDGLTGLAAHHDAGLPDSVITEHGLAQFQKKRPAAQLDELRAAAALRRATMPNYPDPPKDTDEGAPMTAPDMDNDEGMERPYDGRPGGSQNPATTGRIMFGAPPVSAPPAPNNLEPDSGIHHLPDNTPTINTPCATCGGTGIMARTVNGLLAETISQIPLDGGDQIIREFYRRLLTAAPQLATLFPPDLLTAATQDGTSPGALQRDRLLQALVALSELYGTGPDGMARLDTALGSFGRSHAAFARPDGTTRGATVAEYMAVKDTLFGTLTWALGDKLTPAHVQAWSDAYDYAMVGMLYAQQHSDMNFPRQARGPARTGDHSE